MSRQWETVIGNNAELATTIGPTVLNPPSFLNIPCPRSLHAGAIWEDKLIIYGGYDGAYRLNDVHAYNFSTNRWMRMEPRDDVQPSPRDRHSCCIYGDNLIVFAGFDGNINSRINSLFLFDLRNCRWKQISATGDIPSPRHSHGACIYNDCMYVFGGFDGDYRSDLIKLDLAENVWSLLSVHGRVPRGRYRSSCVVYNDSMILYGGHDGSRHLSDTYVFDFPTATWALIETGGIAPSPRDSHGAVIFEDSMFIFGGSNGRALGDFHQLDLSSMVWRPVNQQLAPPVSHSSGASSPSRRSAAAAGVTVAAASLAGYEGRFCHVAVVHDSFLYVFGGYDGCNRLNDMRRFQLSDHLPGIPVPPSSLQADLRSYVNNELLSDIKFVLANGRVVYAHKILCIRCPYFRTMFTGPFLEMNATEIPMPDIDYDTLILVLEHIYCDECRGVSSNNAMEIFQAADRFQLGRLQAFCENAILSSICVDNAATLLLAADVYQAQGLKNKCLQFILNNFDEVSRTSAFEDMGRKNIDLVFEILRMR